MICFKTPYSPADVGYNADRLKVLDNHFQKMMDAGEIIAAWYCLARDGKVFANNALGKFSYRDDETRLVQPDTIQRVASVTKFITATAIFKLVEDGLIRLNQPVGEIIEEFSYPPFGKIHIAHLLTHTSGMPSDPGTFDNRYFKSQWDFIEKAEDDNWIKAGLSAGMRKEPGEEWAYCSFGYAILGEIITRVSGIRAEDYIMENIIKPCEMTDSGFDITPEQVKRHFIINEGAEKEIENFLAHGKQSEGIWDKVPRTTGNLFSTTLDLVKFGTMLLNNGTYNGKRILGRKAVEKMTSFYVTDEVKDYCWGAGGVPRAYGHGPDMRCNLASLYTRGTYFHEGAGAACVIIDPFEKLVAAWFVPWRNDKWCAHGLYNAAAVMWSGLE